MKNLDNLVLGQLLLGAKSRVLFVLVPTLKQGRVGLYST